MPNINEPILGSQRIVDSSEVDSRGFLVTRSDVGSHVDAVWGEIRSLRLRARARELESNQFEQSAERRRVLCAESLELMMQANRLHQLIHPDNELFDRRFKFNQQI